MKYKWWDIGMKLHVPYHKLKEFEKEPELRSLVAVLESSSVDERGLAKTIVKKYCPSEQQKG